MPPPARSTGRKRLKQRLAQYLSRTTRPRLLMSAALVITGASGFLLSHLMREFGLCMALRYPLTVLAAWGVFLLLIWLWVIWQRRRIEQAVMTLTGPDHRQLEAAQGDLAVHTGQRRRKGRSSWGELLTADLSGLGSADGEGGAVVVAILLLIIAFILIFGVINVLVVAPMLQAEILLDLFLVGALGKRLNRAAAWRGRRQRREVAPMYMDNTVATAVPNQPAALGPWPRGWGVGLRSGFRPAERRHILMLVAG